METINANFVNSGNISLRQSRAKQVLRVNPNPTKESQTASPDKYPQGFFKVKPCGVCKVSFSPMAPSEKYCSDPCKDSASTGRYLERKYGLSLDKYHARHAEQDGLCKLCGGEGFLMDVSKHKLKLVVDHCHSTGSVRGLLCHNCNRALGLFKERQDVLLRAVEYLKV